LADHDGGESSAPPRLNSASAVRRALSKCPILRQIARSARVTGGGILALYSREYHVFRAAVFSIVLTLAVGQNAALLCKAWCYPHAATAAACRHQDPTTSPSVTGTDNCNNVAVSAIAFVREDARRIASAPDAQNALVVPRFRFAPPPTDSRSGYESGRLLLHAERPLVIALRI
jgi:hypothetical protein